MIKIADAIKSIIKDNAFLEFGVHHQLFNMSQLAKYLKPFVSARTQKDPTTTAIAMALSRLTPEFIENTPDPADFHIDNISVTAGLFTASFDRTVNAHRGIYRLQTDMHKRNAFCSVSEGMRKVTVIVENQYQKRLLSLVGETPVHQHNNLASVEINFGSAYTEIPGMLYMLLQRAALQNINLVEITSTYSAITMFIAEEDTRILFDTLLNSLTVSKKDVEFSTSGRLD